MIATTEPLLDRRPALDNYRGGCAKGIVYAKMQRP